MAAKVPVPMVKAPISVMSILLDLRPTLLVAASKIDPEAIMMFEREVEALPPPILLAAITVPVIFKVPFVVNVEL